MKLYGHQMVTSKDNKELWIIGGYDSSNYQITDEILKLDCQASNSISSCTFKPISTRLQFARQFHIALTITETFANQLCL